MKSLTNVSCLLLLWSVWLCAATAQAQSGPFRLDRDFVQVPSGSFIMGTQDLEALVFEVPEEKISQSRDELPGHRVVIEKPFYLGKTEVTQAQWYQVMKTRPGPESHWQREDWAKLPIVSVSWLAVQSFLEKLNQQDTALRYRLPTEAEWEYAARAGSSEIRPFERDQLGVYAWYLENSTDRIQAVATRKPNAWGLFDLFGNVWEWVADWYSPSYYAKSAQQDPQGPTTGTQRVRRGGSYHCRSHLVRSAYRGVGSLEQAYSVLGFRLVAASR